MVLKTKHTVKFTEQLNNLIQAKEVWTNEIKKKGTKIQINDFEKLFHNILENFKVRAKASDKAILHQKNKQHDLKPGSEGYNQSDDLIKTAEENIIKYGQKALLNLKSDYEMTMEAIQKNTVPLKNAKPEQGNDNTNLHSESHS